MWRVKTVTKFKNSFFPVLIYWNDNRIHLNTFKKSVFVPMVPPYLEVATYGATMKGGWSRKAPTHDQQLPIPRRLSSQYLRLVHSWFFAFIGVATFVLLASHGIAAGPLFTHVKIWAPNICIQTQYLYHMLHQLSFALHHTPASFRNLNGMETFQNTTVREGAKTATDI